MTTRKTYPTSLRLCSLVAIAFLANSALAFKSEKASVALTPPAPVAPFPFPDYGFGFTGSHPDAGLDTQFNINLPAQFTKNGGHRYVFAILREAQSGQAAFDPARPFLQGLYMCPDSAHSGSLDGCVALSAADVESISYPWVAIRRSWNAEKSEHLTITQAAAAAAGLPASLGRPFFVRYPGKNVRVVSPAKRKDGTPGFVAGQSFVPTSPSNLSALVLRGISLYELSQVPDASFSVQDWVTGNEVCPLTDIDGAFGAEPGQPGYDPGMKSCHDYFGAMAALNSPHFAPGSRSVYDYYHAIALQKMQACKDLLPLQSFYTHNGPWAPVLSANDTEVHECEREAFVFEMFAQHFLQDAWATGHMWHAWGHESLSQFPPYLEPLNGAAWDDASPPSENLQGRRAVIAGMVGAFRGMVHGDQDQATSYLLSPDFQEKYKGKWIPEAVLRAVGADPLNAPFFAMPRPNSTGFGLLDFDLQRVSWLNLNGTRASGAGDGYVNLLLDPLADLRLFNPPQNLGDTYAEARKRLLMCTATSLREIYDAGPKAHGAPGTFSGAWSRTEFDFRNECWTQRATNASMYGSVAPLRVTYDPQFLTAQSVLTNPAALFGLVNKAIVPFLSGGAHLPNVVDRSKFLQRIQDRMVMDATRVTMDYAWNLNDPDGHGADGTESAVGSSRRGGEDEPTIRFLGVSPSGDLANTPPLPYSDLPSPTLPESTAPDQYVTQHMFWRAHVKDICAQSGLLQNLRDRCVAGAALPGGDPDACTACAQVAELHMPPLWYGELDVEPSKCAALGYSGGGGLPASLLNFQDRYLDGTFANQVVRDANSINVPPYFLAVDYCTDTIPHPGDHFGSPYSAEWDPASEASGTLAHSRPIATPDSDTVFCDEAHLTSLTYPVSTKFRHGIISNESANLAGVWIPPLVTALDETLTTTINDGIAVCSGVHVYPPESPFAYYWGGANWSQWWGTLGAKSQSNLDVITQNSLGSAPLFDSVEMGSYALSRRDDRAYSPLDQSNSSGLNARFVPRNIPANELLQFGVCGLVQRVSFHNRSCVDALTGIGRLDLLPFVGAGPQTNGAEVIESSASLNTLPDQPRCSVRQPREVVGCAAGECNAEGLCTSLGKPIVQRFHDPAP